MLNFHSSENFVISRGNKVIFVIIAGETGGARNPNLQVVITHASRVCSHHSFGLPLITRVCIFYTSHSDRACSDHLSRETYAKHSDGAKAFGPQSLSRALTVRTAITVSDVSLTVQLFNFGFFNSFF